MTRIRGGVLAASLVLAACTGGYDENAQDEAAWLLEHEPKSVPTSPEGTWYPTYDGDAFRGMDRHIDTVYGHHLSPDEIEGRNTWLMWTGGNQAFWDHLARHGNGLIDFLRLLDNRFIRREDRFRIMGVVPTPGMVATPPDGEPPDTMYDRSPFNYYGLHLDHPRLEGDHCAIGDDGVYGALSADGDYPEHEIYGYPSGIVGLRLFPRETDSDPRIREEWQENEGRWDADRFIDDPDYQKDPDLIRPFRVGMACAFCHVQANPMNPPARMDQARWSNLSSNIGQQYFWFGRIFGADLASDNLISYLTGYAQPGTLDTSLVATDGNNNPNTMNSVFQLLPRLVTSIKSPWETHSQATKEYMPRLDQGYTTPLDPDRSAASPNRVRPVVFERDEAAFIQKLVGPELWAAFPDQGGGRRSLPALGDDDRRATPKILADGADSIGGRGALCRVYLNIGEYHQEWIQIQNTMVGIVPQRSPFRMEKCAEQSLSWAVTMRRSTNVAKYFLVNSLPMRLENAPGGKEHVLPNGDPDVLRGAQVFAEQCFACHSSLQPEDYRDEFWKDPGDWKRWVQDKDYVAASARMMTDLLKQDAVLGGNPFEDPFFDKFVKENYLSTDARYRVGEIGTNAARALADNAGSTKRMWADYSSSEFKDQDRSPYPIRIADPYDRDGTLVWPLTTDAGPGRYRAPSLSSMWATGPYLHNNTVGYYPYDWSPDPRKGLDGVVSSLRPGVQSVESRVRIFEDGARRLLGLRPTFLDANAQAYRGYSWSPRRGFDSIVRTKEDCHVALPSVLLDDVVEMQTAALFGVGIPGWVLGLLMAAVLLVGVRLFVRGTERLHAGKGVGMRVGSSALLLGTGALLVWMVVRLWAWDEVGVGLIPKGTPVNLLANINGPGWIQNDPERKRLALRALIGFKKVKATRKSLDEVKVFGRPLVDILVELSKCPDLVLDRGHEFGWYDTPELAAGRLVEVPVADREALVEFLKKL